MASSMYLLQVHTPVYWQKKTHLRLLEARSAANQLIGCSSIWHAAPQGLSYARDLYQSIEKHIDIKAWAACHRSFRRTFHLTHACIDAPFDQQTEILAAFPVWCWLSVIESSCVVRVGRAHEEEPAASKTKMG